jgi:Ca2+-binding RTX toxin-like protein
VRRMALVLGAVLFVMLLASGVALAANRIECPNWDGNLCVGTDRADEINGTDRADEIYARDGADVVKGRLRRDVIYGGDGADRINVGACSRDQAFSGRGDDVIDVGDGCVYIPEDPLTPKEVKDFVYCGPGRDVVRNVGPNDEIAMDCERKIRAEF